MAFPTWKEIVFSKKGGLIALYEATKKGLADASAGILAAGSVSTEELADKAVTPAKMSGSTAGNLLFAQGTTVSPLYHALTGFFSIDKDGKITPTVGTGAGYTIALLTTAFGDPATLPNGPVGFYRDTTANKSYLISVYSGVFDGVEQAAVPSS